MKNAKTKLPIKWLAPEVLREKKFTTMSDVWAYGVLVWEVFTRGCLPYGMLSDWTGKFFLTYNINSRINKNFSGLMNHLDAGNRLDKPDHCDDELYEVLMRCWMMDRKKRPKFLELTEFFAKHYNRLGQGVSLSQLFFE